MIATVLARDVLFNVCLYFRPVSKFTDLWVESTRTESTSPEIQAQNERFERFYVSHGLGLSWLSIQELTMSDYHMDNPKAVSFMSTLIESLILYDHLMVDISPTDMGWGLCEQINSLFDEDVFENRYLSHESIQSSRQATRSLYSLRQSLVPDVSIDEAFGEPPGENFSESPTYLTHDEDYFEEAFFQSFGCPEYCNESVPVLVLYYNFVQEQKLSERLTTAYVPVEFIARQYQSIQNEHLIYAPAISPNNIVDFFMKSVGEPLQQRFSSVLGTLGSRAGLPIPPLVRLVAAESQRISLFETIRQLRQSAEAKEYRRYLAKLQSWFRLGNHEKLERELQRLEEISQRWSRSFFKPAKQTRRIGVSVLFVKADIDVPDRRLGAWVPKELAFVHRIVSAQLL